MPWVVRYALKYCLWCSTNCTYKSTCPWFSNMLERTASTFPDFSNMLATLAYGILSSWIVIHSDPDSRSCDQNPDVHVIFYSPLGISAAKNDGTSLHPTELWHAPWTLFENISTTGLQARKIKVDFLPLASREGSRFSRPNFGSMVSRTILF